MDAMVGSQQAKLYADCLQNKYNRRPLIFITNGFEFFYTNDYIGYPRREGFRLFTQGKSCSLRWMDALQGFRLKIYG